MRITSISSISKCLHIRYTPQHNINAIPLLVILNSLLEIMQNSFIPDFSLLWNNTLETNLKQDGVIFTQNISSLNPPSQKGHNGSKDKRKRECLHHLDFSLFIFYYTSSLSPMV